MTNNPDDPLSHALQALTRALEADPPPAVAEAVREAADALLVAVEEHKAFVTVANAAMTLVEALDDYEDATEDGDEAKITIAAEAGEEAEDALVDALNELHTVVSTDADPAFLAALDQFADDEDGPMGGRDDDTPAGPPILRVRGGADAEEPSPSSRRVNLGMKFGAEMNDPPAPRLARLTPHEERVLRMHFGISMNTDSEPEEKP